MLAITEKTQRGRITSICRLALSLFALAATLTLAHSGLAQDITVANPLRGASVQSPAWIRAHNVGCRGLAPVYFGYSIDDSRITIAGVTPYDIDVTRQAIGGGTHTVHFKSWTAAGLCPVVNSTFHVVGASGANAPPPTPSAGAIPAYATSSGDLEHSSNWEYAHDQATPGSSRGSTVFPVYAPAGDVAREFYMTYSNHGGEIYHVTFGKDASATHFVYDTYVYIKDPRSIGNLEMDMNQVMRDGATVIFGTQCASGSGTWEFTTVRGHTSHWSPSNISCDPRTWAANTWHHIQIASHRNDSGVVTYDWVNLDGTHSEFRNATGSAADRLGWPPGDLLINFQIDGSQNDGSVTAYLHKTVVYRW